MSKDFKESKRLPEIYLITVKQGDVWVKKGKELYILTLNRVTITQKATANIPKSCSTESHWEESHGRILGERRHMPLEINSTNSAEEYERETKPKCHFYHPQASWSTKTDDAFLFTQ